MFVVLQQKVSDLIQSAGNNLCTSCFYSIVMQTDEQFVRFTYYNETFQQCFSTWWSGWTWVCELNFGGGGMKKQDGHQAGFDSFRTFLIKKTGLLIRTKCFSILIIVNANMWSFNTSVIYRNNSNFDCWLFWFRRRLMWRSLVSCLKWSETFCLILHNELKWRHTHDVCNCMNNLHHQHQLTSTLRSC